MFEISAFLPISLIPLSSQKLKAQTRTSVIANRLNVWLPHKSIYLYVHYLHATCGWFMLTNEIVPEREEGEESNWGCANEEGQKTSSIIWGVGSRFGTNTMKAWIHLGLYGYFRVLVVVLWFGDHFGDFGLFFFLAKCWFSCHSLLENCCRPCPSLQDHSIPIFFQQDNTPCHKAQLV